MTTLDVQIKSQHRLRDEDEPLLRGRGRYTDDLRFSDEAYMYVVRAPLAAGRIISIDIDSARKMNGVIGVFSGEDLAKDGLGGIKAVANFDRPDGTPMINPPFDLLARESVRYVGDPVAIVVAETRFQAEDAAEAVEVEYSHLPAVTDVADATSDDAPLVWPEVSGNISFRIERGDRAAAEDAFKRADHVTELTLRISRVSANPIEPRCAIGQYDPDADKYVLYASIQSPHRVRNILAKDVFRVEPEKLRIISGDVGGSFGMKNSPYVEQALVLWAARKTGRTIRWIPTRTESFISDCHARDNLTTVSLALDKDGIFLGLKVKTLANLGAYLNAMTPHPPTANLGGLAGVYRTPCIYVDVQGVHTHTNPTSAYRGAGRPEATYVIERVIDVAAAELGLDRVDLRRRNMIQPNEMPFKTGLVYTYDSGDFPKVMDRAIEVADWEGFPARREAAQAGGRLRGIGISNPIEIAGGPFGKPNPEYAEIKIDKTGMTTLFLGSHDVGQGHTTSFRQLAAQVLGLAPDTVHLVTGDTERVTKGTGTFGSRTLSAAGAAFNQAARDILEKMTPQAADHLGVPVDQIDFSDGVFRARGTNKTSSLQDLVKGTGTEVTASAWTSTNDATFPNGCHICEVEVDPETGKVSVESYTVVDDVGTVLNLAIVKGQIQGGVAQGLGQALMEQISYDPESGQLITGSFVDYAMPHCDHLSDIHVESHPVPTAVTPFGVKGAGEAGTVGALPAVVSAVVDALSPLGVHHLDMPLTPEKIWRAVRDASKSA